MTFCPCNKVIYIITENEILMETEILDDRFDNFCSFVNQRDIIGIRISRMLIFIFFIPIFKENVYILTILIKFFYFLSITMTCISLDALWVSLQGDEFYIYILYLVK